MLQYLEQQTGRPTAECFRTIAGTSTGGILAAALSVPDADLAPKFSATRVVDLYEDMAPLLFRRRLFNRVPGSRFLKESYSAERLERLLKGYLGDYRLSDALSRLPLPAADVAHGSGIVLDSHKARAGTQSNLRLVTAVRATSAAPTFFRPVTLRRPDGSLMQLIDGGVFANNPSEVLVSALREPDPLDGGAPISVTPMTGARPVCHFARHGDPNRQTAHGQVAVCKPATSVGGLRPHAAAGRAQHLPDERLTAAVLSRPHVRYVRFQTSLDKDIPLDAADIATRKKLRAAAEELIVSRRDDLDELAAWLQTGPAPPSARPATNP